jgi:hypothetical protein
MIARALDVLPLNSRHFFWARREYQDNHKPLRPENQTNPLSLVYFSRIAVPISRQKRRETCGSTGPQSSYQFVE